MRSGRWVGPAVALALLVCAAPASAAGLLSQPVTAASALDKSCTSGQRTGTSVAQRRVVMPLGGEITASLTAASGDWDLAIIDPSDGRIVAGSAYQGADEVASGFAATGNSLIVQACRRSGGSSTAQLSVQSFPIDTSKNVKASLVRVQTANLDRKNQLNALGLDLTEHGGAGYVEAVLYGSADAQKLVNNNFAYTTEVPDLSVQARQDRAADARFAAANTRSAFPSGRTTYRRLFDYSEDMKALVRDNPGLVRPITLKNKTYEGRSVEGIEIATNVAARDGRPTFLQLGVHHAREWPSGEHAMEWAYELVNGYRNGDARDTDLVTRTRTIIVPIVNPDGFNASREAGELYGNGGGHATDLDGDGEISDPEFIAASTTHLNEYRRKNCRFPVIDAAVAAGNCIAQPDQGVVGGGVDPNRNYGAFWGGNGSSDTYVEQDYRGPGPFSEPESQNIRELVSGRQIVTLITNHTFSGLVLRPPGVASQGTTVDEPLFKALGDAMAAENGYASQYGYQLYDTTGTTEDWSYNATAGLGYTFEIGHLGFHPPYEVTVQEWEGTTDYATGGGNRAAYYLAQENTADQSKHSVLTGQAPNGSVLRLTKSFDLPTSQEGMTIHDTLNSSMVVSDKKGNFQWDVNPSTRPLVAKSSGRPATGDPSPPQQFESDGSTTPCANYDTPPPDCYEDHLITVPSGTGIDNAKATFRIEFSPASDYDMKLYRADANGNATGDALASSGHGATDGEVGYEEATILDPAGSYVVRVQNYAGVDPWTGTVTYAGPDPYSAPMQEAYTLTCETPQGVVKAARQVFVARGERLALDLRKDCRR
jgi:Zinc carboxypeptidase